MKPNNPNKPAPRAHVKEEKRWIEENYFADWNMERDVAENDLLDETDAVCVCGKPNDATHFLTCRKFQAAVDARAVHELRHLLPRKANR